MIFSVTIIFLLLFLLFILLLLTKQKFSAICALCGAVVLTWIFLLILMYLQVFSDKTIIALLLGSSLLGFYYVVEKKIEERYLLFRLPFYLTLLLVSYLVIEQTWVSGAALLVAMLWLLSGCLFFYRRNPYLQSSVEKIIACCKNW